MSNISTRPDVLAAVFFAAGMAFQRQVDSANRLRMYRGSEDPVLLGENSTFLLEDVSPTSRSEASRNPEVQHFYCLVMSISWAPPLCIISSPKNYIPVLHCFFLSL